MAAPLDPAIRDQVFGDLRTARGLAEAGQVEEADLAIRRAWGQLPEPKLSWDISRTALSSIAKLYRDLGRFPEALTWANEYFNSNTLPGDGTPLILLGSIHYQAGDLEAAREHFHKAFVLAGKRAFAGENPEFFKLARAKTDTGR